MCPGIPEIGYVMGYQSVGIQFVWSVLQNLMHKLPGTTFIFFLGWKFSICQPLTLFHYFSQFSEIYWTLIYCYWYYCKRTFKFGAAFVNCILYNVLIKKNAQIQNIYLPNPLGQVFKIPPFSARKSHSEGGRGGPLDYLFSWIQLFLLLRSACKIPNTYDKSFWENE